MANSQNPYKPRTFKPSSDEDPNVLEFINKQDNFNDTIRYLIEKEIYENGIRNLQMYIPRTRTNEYFDSMCKVNNNLSSYNSVVKTINNTNTDYKLNTNEVVVDLAKSNIEEVVKIKEETKLIDIPDCYD